MIRLLTSASNLPSWGVTSRMSLVRERLKSCARRHRRRRQSSCARRWLWVMLSGLFVRGVWVKHRCDPGPFLNFSTTTERRLLLAKFNVQRPRWNNIKPHTRKAFQSLLQGLGAFEIPESREKSSFDSSYLQSKLLKNSQCC